MQDQHPYLGPGVAGGQSLAVRPHTEHRIALARVELGYDRDLHQR
jgi:hypothetical protein